MGKIILALALLGAAATAANAATVPLKGKAADAFIARHFPNASIPGPLMGRFVYFDRWGRRRMGHAHCEVPAMGARSDGAVSTCVVRY